MWKGMDKQQVTTDALVDLSKAFDKADHKILLDKMTKWSIYCDWFRSYLTARTQAVQQDGSMSEFLPTTSGVPQGSCLGPVLFSIYTNDLPRHINSKVVMYADDTQLDDQQSAATTLQSDLMGLELWMVKNHQTINTAKTQVITFGSRSQVKKVAADIANSLRIGQTTLKRINEVKNLGVGMDTSLSWQSHIKPSSKLKDELDQP